jgi:hypothetical protein
MEENMRKKNFCRLEKKARKFLVGKSKKVANFFDQSLNKKFKTNLTTRTKTKGFGITVSHNEKHTLDCFLGLTKTLLKIPVKIIVISKT